MLVGTCLVGCYRDTDGSVDGKAFSHGCQMIAAWTQATGSMLWKMPQSHRLTTMHSSIQHALLGGQLVLIHSPEGGTQLAFLLPPVPMPAEDASVLRVGVANRRG